MAAFDHVAKSLKEANGGDGVISRDDAKKLVAQLEKDGKGTEALAAKNIFAMVDARDAKPGAKVTAYDLDKTRDFVQQKMLENRDINKNGYARAEIEKMSPTGRALVELGQVLAMDKPKARIGYAIPEAGLKHTTSLLKSLLKSDPVASRAEANALVRKLNKEGRGTEALAAGTFFKFIDFRDFKPGAKVTATDINKAEKYAAETMLKSKDHNKNGYSAAEVEKFSKSAKAFLLLGQMINAGIIKA